MEGTQSVPELGSRGRLVKSIFVIHHIDPEHSEGSTVGGGWRSCPAFRVAGAEGGLKPIACNGEGEASEE